MGPRISTFRRINASAKVDEELLDPPMVISLSAPYQTFLSRALKIRLSISYDTSGLLRTHFVETGHLTLYSSCWPVDPAFPGDQGPSIFLIVYHWDP